MIQMEAEKRGPSRFSPRPMFTPHLVQMARVSDICIMMAPSHAEPQQRDIVLDMLLRSGVPLLLVPTLWKKQAPPRRAVGLGR